MSLISVPFFKTDKTEALEAADVYDISSSKPVNKLYDAAKQGASKLFDAAGGRVGVQNGIQNLISAKLNGADGRSMLEAGLGMFNTSTVGILKSAGNGLFDQAAEFMDLDPSMAARIKGTSEGVFNKIAYGDPSDLSGYGDLVSLMGNLTGKDDWANNVNVGLESAVWGSALSQSVKYGQYNYLKDVKVHIDPEVYQQSLIYSVPAVASSGSLEALKNLMTELSNDKIMFTKPDFIKTFLGQFSLPDPMTTTREVYANDLVNTLTLLSPKWYLYSRQAGQEIVDLTNLQTANKVALTLLELHDVLGKYAIAAGVVKEQSVEESMKEQFPMMVTSLS